MRPHSFTYNFPFCAAFEWIERSPVGEFMRSSRVVFPIVESIHLIGLALFVGTLLLIDMGLLGIAHAPPTRPTGGCRVGALDLERIRLMMLTGPFMFTAQAAKWHDNPVFWIKMLLLIIATVFQCVGASRKNPLFRTQPSEADWRHIPDTLDQHRTFVENDGVCMKRMLVALAFVGFLRSGAQEAQIEERLHHASGALRCRARQGHPGAGARDPAIARDSEKGIARRATCQLGHRRRSRPRNFAGSGHHIGASSARSNPSHQPTSLLAQLVRYENVTRILGRSPVRRCHARSWKRTTRAVSAPTSL